MVTGLHSVKEIGIYSFTEDFFSDRSHIFAPWKPIEMSLGWMPYWCCWWPLLNICALIDENYFLLASINCKITNMIMAGLTVNYCISLYVWCRNASCFRKKLFSPRVHNYGWALLLQFSVFVVSWYAIIFFFAGSTGINSLPGTHSLQAQHIILSFFCSFSPHHPSQW